MKNILKTLFKYKMSIFFFIIISFIVSFFISEYIYNNNYANYKINIEGENIEEVMTKSSFDDIFTYIDNYNNNLEEGKKKISYANIDYEAMLKDSSLEQIDENHYSLYVKIKYFPSINRVSNGVVNEGISRVRSYFKIILTYTDKSDNINIDSLDVSTSGYVNSYIVSSISSLSIALIYLIILVVLIINNKNKEIVEIHDNENIYKYPFRLSYWKKSTKIFTSVRNLCMIAILFALMMICKFISLPSGFGTLGIGITYLVFSIISLIYGPVCGIIIGFFSDCMGYVLFPSPQGFFFGYTLSAMLTGFIYGIFFYRTKITFAKCLYARIFVNLFINVVLGTIWWSIIYDLNSEATMVYLLTMALPKNLIYLLPQSILLFLVLKYVLKPLKSFGLVDEKIVDNVSLL